MPENKRGIKAAILLITLLVITAAAILFYFKSALIKVSLPKPVTIDTHDQPTLGQATAPIHIVIFEDLKCVNCARFNNTVLPVLKKKYIDTGEAKYTMINLAFIPGSLPAANAARCVYVQNNALFFDFVDYVYQHQPPETQDWATIPKLLSIASQFHLLNQEQFTQCLLATPYDHFIRENLTQATKLMHGTVATPTVYVNGIKISIPTEKEIESVIADIKK